MVRLQGKVVARADAVSTNAAGVAAVLTVDAEPAGPVTLTLDLETRGTQASVTVDPRVTPYLAFSLDKDGQVVPARPSSEQPRYA